MQSHSRTAFSWSEAVGSREHAQWILWLGITLQSNLHYLLTFVCVGVFLLLIPDLASCQGVGCILSEEGDNMAAWWSQSGVQ